MSWIKIGNTEFNKEAVKEMSLAKFKKVYSHLGDSAETLYYRVSGKKKTKKKEEEK